MEGKSPHQFNCKSPHQFNCKSNHNRALSLPPRLKLFFCLILMHQKMFVLKRDGTKSDISFNDVSDRIRDLCDSLNVDYNLVAQKVISNIYPGISTKELDDYASEVCAFMSQKNTDYQILAKRITVSNLHKSTVSRFSAVCEMLYNYNYNGEPASLITKELYDFVMVHRGELDNAIEHSRDFDYDFFGFKTLLKSYLLKIDGEIAERPQHMLMRVACALHLGNIDDALETYDIMSRRLYTHATPTLYNAGTYQGQLSSCFLLSMRDDSIEGIFETLQQCAVISKNSGGIGLSVSNIRGNGSYIRKTNGNSSGLVPMLKVFNDVARYVDQSGRRKGSFAIYIEPWHSDVFEVLDLKKNNGDENRRARDLFFAMWIPDLFMKRVDQDDDWSLMCPDTSKGLVDLYGSEFEKVYQEYESRGKFVKKIKARTLWHKILESQIETGVPYIMFKDSCNEKSNQKNLGVIHSSNLCSEVVQYSDKNEIAVCNLASVSLSSCVVNDHFDYDLLERVTRIACKNLNRVVDINKYPLPETHHSNTLHRPIGIGVQGLQDVFFKLKVPFDSAAAAEINKNIFETMYYAAVHESMTLAKEHGCYESFHGSPASNGLLQFDLWGHIPSSRYDWKSLKNEIMEHGLRNSLLLCCQPTASTAQILGNTESFEPQTSNLFSRRTLSGDFLQINEYLADDLRNLGIWDDEMVNDLIRYNGSVQSISRIPQNLKDLYKTVWEIKQKVIIEMSASRGPYICQSQSLNLFFATPAISKMSAAYFYGWRRGLKTGCYYLRSKACSDALKFSQPVVDVCESCTG